MPKNYNFCVSKLKTTKEEFEWTIDNFSERQKKNGEYMESAKFTLTATNGAQLKWILRVYPNGEKRREDAKDSLSLYLGLHNVQEEPVLAKFRFALRNSQGTLYKPYGDSAICEFGDTHSTWGLPFVKRSVLMDKKYGLLPDDRLAIVCECTVQEEMMTSADIADKEVPECRALEDMGHMFEKSLFTDCTIKCDDGKEFKVHKCILSCRSKYFGAMFEHGMTEARNNCVKIKDIQSDVLEQMLLFIYSGKAADLKKWAEELLVAADKYQLDRLKILCEHELADSMQNANACELAILANHHSGKHLKAKAIKFIQLHAKEVMETEGWKILVKGNNGELFDELMKAIYADSK